ncbi:MAG: hypothetical protein LUE93_09085, partial [Bacteroides sp.]|nr:hypothetical protein [Bacteroides sp.]
LLYFRTYFSAIPLASYGLAGNLEDFKSSVYASLRWYDAVFLMTTLFPLFLWRKKYKEPAAPITGSAMLSSTRYLVLPVMLLLWLSFSIQRKGGFHQVYNRHESPVCLPAVLLFIRFSVRSITIIFREKKNLLRKSTVKLNHGWQKNLLTGRSLST